MPLFTGESALHIFAVNEREHAFVRMVKLAYDELSDEQAHLLFQSQAEGLFFTKKPMLFFGGSPCAAAGLEGCCSCLCLCRFHQPRGALITRLRRLQYAISFEMFDAVRELLSTGLVNLNDKAAASEQLLVFS